MNTKPLIFKNFFVLTSACFLISMFVITASFGAENDKKNDETVLATVGPKKITVSEFNKKFEEVRRAAVNPPTKAQFLEDLVRYELGLLEAEKKGLNNDPTIQDRMRQELYKGLLERELGEKVQKISITDKDMKEYYQKNPEIRSSHILIELKPGATAEQRTEAKKRADEIFSEVKKSKRTFEELVKLYSDDSVTKPAGGDVGWQSRVTVFPSYYDALIKGKNGQIVPYLVETPFGYHIVKVSGRRTFENSNKRQLRTATFDDKRKDVFNEYFERLKKNYTIKTNAQLLE